MPMYATVGGVQRELSAVPVTVAGVEREQDQMLATIDGVAREIFASGFKWERYALSATVEIKDEVGMLTGMVTGDKFYKQAAGNFSVYTVGGDSFVYMDADGSTSCTTGRMSSLAPNLTNRWFMWKPTAVSTMKVYAEHAYYGNGQYVNSNDRTGTLDQLGYSKIASIVQTKGSYIDTVTDKSETAYPDNGVQNGYWYVKI